MRGVRWVVPVLGLAALAGLSAVFAVDHPLYMAVLTALMLQPGTAPFIDIAQMPGVVDCWRQGIDPYVTASCDLAGRVFAYSPLWLRFGFLPSDPGATPWLGLGLAGAFFLSLALLPAPRRAGGVFVLALAAFASLPVFALERANIDVAMFLLVIAGGRLCGRDSGARFAGYPLFLLAGLLKFYPLVLCLLFLRERFRQAALLSLLAVGVVMLFILHFRAELIEMAGNLPNLGYFTDTFGARQLSIGLGAVLQDLGIEQLPVLGSVDPKRSIMLTLDILVASHLIALACAIRLALQPALGTALDALTAAERAFLVIGAALLCGCFFAGQNAGYRGIHFLFVMPGLAVLAQGTMRKLFRGILVLALLLLWGLTLQQLVAWLSGGSARPMGGSVAMELYWIGHELAWWSVITVLLAVLFRFVLAAPLWRRPWSA